MAVFTGNGSATAPSFTFSSDTNLGIYRGGTDIISFSTDGTERARFDAAGALEIGGTLGSDPNISLNGDGTATFAGNVGIGADSSPKYLTITRNTTGSANGCGGLRFSNSTLNITEIEGQTDGVNAGAISFKTVTAGGSSLTEKARITNAGSFQVGASASAPNISLNADGSAVYLGALGVYRTDATQATYAGYLNGTNTSIIYADGKARFDDTVGIGNIAGSPNISLNADGSADFAGIVQSGGNPFLGAARGATLEDGGVINVCNTPGTASIFRGYTQGTNTALIDLKADGSAIFAEDITINGLTVGRGGGDVASNTAVGNGALASNTTGYNSTANGLDALSNNTEGLNNTANGAYALEANTTGDDNTANGVQALYSNTTGTNNTANGRDALYSNTTGTNNTANGKNALYENTAGNNGTAVGFQSQYYANDTTTAFTNTNVSVGYESLRGSTTAANNTGLDNTAVGYQAMLTNSSGSSNTAVGLNTLAANTTGGENVAIGQAALFANTTAGENTAVGASSMGSNITGFRNSAIGNDAGRYKQDGTNNTDFDNCSFIGYDTRTSGDNQVQLGDSSTTTYVYGTVQNRSDERDKTDIRDTLLGLEFVKSLRPVDFRWDYRDDYFEKEEYEEDVIRTRLIDNPAYTEDGDEPEFLEEEYIETVTKERLVPVTKDGSRARTRFHHGLIAQEVKTAADAQGVDFAGYQDHSVNGGNDVLTIGYNEMIAPLIKAVQELSAENADLKARLDAAGI